MVAHRWTRITGNPGNPGGAVSPDSGVSPDGAVSPDWAAGAVRFEARFDVAPSGLFMGETLPPGLYRLRLCVVRHRFRLSTASQWGAVAAIGVFAIQLLQVRWWSSRLPISDEWQTIKIFGPAGRSGVRVSMLWEQHNEHRIVIANAVFLVVRKLGGWVILAPHIVSALMMATTVGVVVRTLIRLRIRPVLVALAAGTALTPLQWENTIWGFQVQFFALILGVVATVCCVALHPVADRRTAITVVVGALWCSGTISSGLLTWVLGIGLLMVVGVATKSVRSALRWSAMVGVVAVVVGIIFRLGYVTIPRMGTGGTGNYLRWMGRAVVFPHAGFGGGGTTDRSLPMGAAFGTVIGALMICILISGLAISWRNLTRPDGLGRVELGRVELGRVELGRVVFCLGLAGWVGVQIVLIGFARAASGSLASRYSSVLIWLLVAALVASDRVLEELSGRQLMPAAGLVATVIVLSTIQHLGAFRSVETEATSWASRGTLATTREFFDRGLEGNVASPNPYANERVFGELLRESKAKGWLGQLPDIVKTELAWKPTTQEGDAWSQGGEYVADGTQAKAPSRWASWTGADGRVGTLVSQPIEVTSDMMTVVVSGGPEQPGNSIELVDDVTYRTVGRFDGPPAQGGTATWTVNTASLRGKIVRLRAVDNATGYLGWFGIDAPLQPSRLSRTVDRLIGWSPALLFGAVALVLMRLLLPSHRPATFD
jgi:hypothetical protein